MSLHRTLNIASMTIEENIRKRIIYILLLISLALVGTSSLINTFGLGAQASIVKDLSITGIGFFGVLFTISLFLNAVTGEIDQRTIYPMLAQPITRADYLWGKFTGIFAIIATYLLILGVELMIVLLPLVGSLDFNIMQAVLLIILQCGILGAAVLLFSLFTSYPLTITISLFLYIVGSLSSTYVGFLFHSSSKIFAQFVGFIKLIFPKFDVFDIKNAMVHDHPVAHTYVIAAIIYGVLYIVATMILAEIIFERKDL